MALILVLWLTMTVSSIVVMTVAMALWLRDVVRGEDDDAHEPSPLDTRAVPFMLMTVVVLAGVRLSRGQPLSFIETVFPEAFIGFALSAGWYLLARRSPEAHTKQIGRASAAVAVSFGALSAFAS